jgi:hypothetical protein
MERSGEGGRGWREEEDGEGDSKEVRGPVSHLDQMKLHRQKTKKLVDRNPKSGKWRGSGPDVR